MINIEGLNPRQHTVCELLWSCEDLDAVKELIGALPTHEDRVDAASLAKIMMWITVEQELGLGDYEDAALAAIDHAMR